MYDENLCAPLWNPIVAMVDADASPSSEPRRGVLEALRDRIAAAVRTWSSETEGHVGAEPAGAADAAGSDDRAWDEVELRAAAFYFSGLW